jgi:hypothetical protein
MQRTKSSMVKGNKAIKQYLSYPSKWSKMQFFGLVVALSSNKPSKYSIQTLEKYPKASHKEYRYTITS